MRRRHRDLPSPRREHRHPHGPAADASGSRVREDVPRSGRRRDDQGQACLRHRLPAEPKRCWTTSDPVYLAYHDEEWGRPVVDERALLERLCLEGFQSGLSWLTILRKRENFRAAFAGFDPAVIAGFGKRDVARLLRDAGIVRHRGKLEAAIANAQGTLALRAPGRPRGRAAPERSRAVARTTGQFLFGLVAPQWD